MTITNKLKSIAKAQINHIIQRIPVSDLRSILASRGVLIFESERESHLHSLSVLHSDLKRMFNTGEVESYREGDHDYSTFHFDVYLTASLNLVDDLWIPGEEPPAVDAQRNLESAVQAWNAQHGTELLTIDESELSELQEEARRYRSGHNLDKAEISKIRARHTSALADQLSVIQQRDDEVRDLKEKLELEIRLRVEDAEEYNDMRGQRDALKKELAFTEERLGHALDREAKLINENVDLIKRCGALAENLEELEDRAQELQGELDNWHSLGSGYGVRFDVSDVEEKLDILAEWEDVIGLGWSSSEIEEKLEDANDWVELGDDTGMTPCEVQQELDRLEEVDADLREANNRLSSAKSKALEIGLVWRSLEIALDC